MISLTEEAVKPFFSLGRALREEEKELGVIKVLLELRIFCTGHKITTT